MRVPCTSGQLCTNQHLLDPGCAPNHPGSVVLPCPQSSRASYSTRHTPMPAQHTCCPCHTAHRTPTVMLAQHSTTQPCQETHHHASTAHTTLAPACRTAAAMPAQQKPPACWTRTAMSPLHVSRSRSSSAHTITMPLSSLPRRPARPLIWMYSPLLMYLWWPWWRVVVVIV